MVSYSQNKEDLKVKRYFGENKGTLLSIGENNGVDLSNAKLLIDNGWHAYLLEPSSVYNDLKDLYQGNDRVNTFGFGIGAKTGTVKFWESSEHIKGGKDKALVSSIDYKETERWRKSGVEFTEKTIEVKSFKEFWMEEGKPIFDFISIDTEGQDEVILKQINLKEVGCKCLVIEWNGDNKLEKSFTDYCNKFGLKEIHRNAENLIFAI